MINIYILMGGMTGTDIDFVTDAGMFLLKGQIEQIPNTVCKAYAWGSWHLVDADIATVSNDDLVVVIGYSGGGSRATYAANLTHPRIALMVLYDPSPAGQMMPIGPNVLKAINYHNTDPGMSWPGVGPLGGGVLTGQPADVMDKVITSIDIAENHLLVENDQSLHERTIVAIKELTA